MRSQKELNERSHLVLLRRCVCSNRSNGNNGSQRRTPETIFLSCETPSQAVGEKNSLQHPRTRLNWLGELPWKNSATMFPAAGSSGQHYLSWSRPNPRPPDMGAESRSREASNLIYPNKSRLPWS